MCLSGISTGHQQRHANRPPGGRERQFHASVCARCFQYLVRPAMPPERPCGRCVRLSVRPTIACCARAGDPARRHQWCFRLSWLCLSKKRAKQALGLRLCTQHGGNCEFVAHIGRARFVALNAGGKLSGCGYRHSAGKRLNGCFHCSTPSGELDGLVVFDHDAAHQVHAIHSAMHKAAMNQCVDHVGLSVKLGQGAVHGLQVGGAQHQAFSGFFHQLIE